MSILDKMKNTALKHPYVTLSQLFFEKDSMEVRRHHVVRQARTAMTQTFF